MAVGDAGGADVGEANGAEVGSSTGAEVRSTASAWVGTSVGVGTAVVGSAVGIAVTVGIVTTERAAEPSTGCGGTMEISGPAQPVVRPNTISKGMSSKRRMIISPARGLLHHSKDQVTCG
jgi:hypothetical protein